MYDNSGRIASLLVGIIVIVFVIAPMLEMAADVIERVTAILASLP